MYIEKTTSAERLIIARAVDGIFADIMRARRMLMDVLSDHFEYAEQKEIGKEDAERMADILHSINVTLWAAELEYDLTTGENRAPGCDSYYECARRAQLARDVEQLRDKLTYKETAPYAELDDETALPILREIAEKVSF